MNDISIVPMRRRHLRSVLRIEAQVYPRPWTLTLFLTEIGMKSSRHYVVAHEDGEVIGYAGLLLSFDEAHVTNIAVDPRHQRRHVGTFLMLELNRAALERGARHLTLEVRVSNSAAQAMYRRFGFETEGVRPKYYENTEDALVMWAHDIDSTTHAERIASIAASVGLLKGSK